MGGGAAMRSAARVSGFDIAKSGNRGARFLRSPENPVTQKPGQAFRPAATTTTLSERADVVPLQETSWELDDWEFTRFGDEELSPRIVFGSAPSFDEAKSATTDLKFALEKASVFSDDAKEITDPLGIPYTSSAANRAFVLLNQSPVAQSVVASIASDPKVWEAVMQSPALIEFIGSQNKVEKAVSCESVADNMSPREGSSPEESAPNKNVLESIKDAIFEMANNAFAHIKSVFGIKGNEKVSGESEFENSRDSSMNNAVASFMGLAIMVIMVIVFKRN